LVSKESFTVSVGLKRTPEVFKVILLLLIHPELFASPVSASANDPGPWLLKTVAHQSSHSQQLQTLLGFFLRTTANGGGSRYSETLRVEMLVCSSQ
jgi:hypothetical protein